MSKLAVAAASGTVVAVGSSPSRTGSFGDDTVEVENTVFIATIIDGGPGGDWLGGGSANDVLLGSWHDDVIMAAAGNDRLVGGAGSDWLLGQEGNDEYAMADVGYAAELDLVLEFAGQGSDHLQFAATSASLMLTADLATSIATGVAELQGWHVLATQAFAGSTLRYVVTLPALAAYFENVTGGAGDDVIVGNNAANTLRGGPGNDTAEGDVAAWSF